MSIKLNIEEKKFLEDVINELKHYQISAEDRKNIEQQLLEHIEESREHGRDSIDELGDTTTFVKDFLEISGIDLHAEIKQIRNSKSRTGILFVIGFLTLFLTYLATQLLLSMFLTESFNPLVTSSAFEYNILYRISDNVWWNSLLMMISFATACFLSVLVVLLFKQKWRVR